MKSLFLSSAMLALTCTALAQSDTTKYLEEVIVTASKTSRKQNETGKVVSVISQKQIQQMPGKTLAEILNTAPGLQINGADNNLGTNPTPYLRGAGSSQTLILLDGMPLYDAAGIGSEFDLNNFDISQIERIEILKGSQSTLYGSDAVAGVINIISKTVSDQPIHVSADLAAGSYETYKAAISLNGTLAQKHTYQISYSKLNSAGFSAAWDSTGKNKFDNDAFNRDAFQVKYGFKASERTSLQLFGKYTEFGGDIDAGAFTDDRDYTYKNKNTVAGIMANHRFNNGFLQLQYQYNQYHRTFVDDSTHVGGFSKYQNGDYEGISHFAEAYANWKPAAGIEILAGADFRRNITDQLYEYLPFGMPAVPLSGDSANSNQFSAYTSVHVKANKGFQMEVGSRWNYHSTYGSNYTSSVNPFYLFDNGVKIYGSVASGYHVPSLYQLYSEYGNKELSPETTLSFEAGVQLNADEVSGRITGFRRLGKDVIFFYTDPVTFAGEYRNGDAQKDYGVEAEGKVQIARNLSATANYTFVDGAITTQASGKDSSYFNLYKRPKHTVNLTVDYQPLEKLFTSLRFKAAGKAYESQYMAEPFELAGYYTLNFTAAYKISNVIRIYADLQNITDQKYFVTRGYSTKGFNFMAGARLTF